MYDVDVEVAERDVAVVEVADRAEGAKIIARFWVLRRRQDFCGGGGFLGGGGRFSAAAAGFLPGGRGDRAIALAERRRSFWAATTKDPEKEPEGDGDINGPRVCKH